ncbi:MAG: ABC transporter permease [Deinococcus sp.]|nr:ABC transporter permease [Deinococcus sp.]
MAETRLPQDLALAAAARAERARGARVAWSLLAASPTTLLGLGLVLLLILTALLAPFIAPYPDDATKPVLHIRDRLKPPSWAHPFGTDELGKDILSRVVFGARVTIEIVLRVVGLAMLIGVPLGAMAGFLGGWVSTVLLRLTDVFLALPGLVLSIAIVMLLGPSLSHAMLALALVWWPGYARLTQGQVLSLKQEGFVEAARCVGVSPSRIIFDHILRNAVTPLIVKASLDMGYAILAAAGLGYIGLGAQPPTPEWGVMISKGRNYLADQWWYTVFPGLAIFLSVLGFNLLGDGFRDMLDPNAHGR